MVSGFRRPERELRGPKPCPFLNGRSKCSAEALLRPGTVFQPSAAKAGVSAGFNGAAETAPFQSTSGVEEAALWQERPFKAQA